ncbi:MAG: leucine-rich repeat protein [Alphaproteobacteria bacterium]|nr:leucine-rich repeat protein [Alphaproteobacteria bacterium]
MDFSSQQSVLPDKYALIGGRVIHYNREINNVYFGEDFYVKDGVVHELDKNTEIMLDSFVFNIKDKTIADPANQEDGFIAAFQDEIQDKAVQIAVNDKGHKCVVVDGVCLLELDRGQIVSLNFPNLKSARDEFLFYNHTLTTFDAPNLTSVGSAFLQNNDLLTTFDASKLTSVGNGFLASNTALTTFDAPNLTSVGNHFLRHNTALTTFTAPKLREPGKNFFSAHTNRDKFLPRSQKPLRQMRRDGGR